MARAKLRLLEWSRKTREDATAEAVAFNESILRSASSSTREKQDAQRELNEIFGIYSPKNFRVGDPNGKPIEPVIAPSVTFVLPDNGRNK